MALKKSVKEKVIARKYVYRLCRQGERGIL